MRCATNYLTIFDGTKPVPIPTDKTADNFISSLRWKAYRLY